MASYNSSQLEKMQQEAYNRVNEMHKRSQAIVNGTSEKNVDEKKKEVEQASIQKENQAPNVKGTSQTGSFSDLLTSLFSQNGNIKNLSSMWDFKIDEEKALIGIIIYILAKNKADPKLLIGLGYLLL